MTESIGDGRQPQKSSPTTMHSENVSTAESGNGMGDRTRNSATLTTFPFSRDTINLITPILPFLEIERPDKKKDKRGSINPTSESHKAAVNRTTKSSLVRIGERSSLYDLVSSFFQDVHPRHDGDEHGLLMNFDETCASIAVGQLSIGIRVTAPKIRDRLRVLDDNDYLR